MIVVARTEPDAGAHGISLLVAERGMPGFTRGRKLDKIGLQLASRALWRDNDQDLVRTPADPGRSGSASPSQGGADLSVARLVLRGTVSRGRLTGGR